MVEAIPNSTSSATHPDVLDADLAAAVGGMSTDYR
jgi:hypothetical protein